MRIEVLELIDRLGQVSSKWDKPCSFPCDTDKDCCRNLNVGSVDKGKASPMS